jgi:hypothetical protein
MTTGYRDHRGHADLWLDGCCQLNHRREALAQDEDRRRLDEAGAAERFAMVQAELARGRYRRGGEDRWRPVSRRDCELSATQSRP